MGTVLAITSALSNVYAQNKGLEAQAKAQQATARNLITSMNYSFQNLEQERRDAFEATIAELENIKLQGNRQVSAVTASVNEGLAGGGRTADLIKRSSQADVNRAINSAKTNYQMKSNEIDLNKEATALNTKQQITSMPKIEKPSILSTLLALGSSYYQWKTTNESIDAIRNNAGVNGQDTAVYDDLLSGSGYNLSFNFSPDNPININRTIDIFEGLSGNTFNSMTGANVLGWGVVNPPLYYRQQKG